MTTRRLALLIVGVAVVALPLLAYAQVAEPAKQIRETVQAVYTRDANGFITGRTITVTSVSKDALGNTTTTSAVYNYDLNGQLSTVTTTSNTVNADGAFVASATSTMTYNYDGAGNLLGATSTTTQSYVSNAERTEITTLNITTQYAVGPNGQLLQTSSEGTGTVNMYESSTGTTGEVLHQLTVSTTYNYDYNGDGVTNADDIVNGQMLLMSTTETRNQFSADGTTLEERSFQTSSYTYALIAGEMKVSTVTNSTLTWDMQAYNAANGQHGFTYESYTLQYSYLGGGNLGTARLVDSTAYGYRFSETAGWQSYTGSGYSMELVIQNGVEQLPNHFLNHTKNFLGNNTYIFSGGTYGSRTPPVPAPSTP